VRGEECDVRQRREERCRRVGEERASVPQPRARREVRVERGEREMEQSRRVRWRSSRQQRSYRETGAVCLRGARGSGGARRQQRSQLQAARRPSARCSRSALRQNAQRAPSPNERAAGTGRRAAAAQATRRRRAAPRSLTRWRRDRRFIMLSRASFSRVDQRPAGEA
jgi:hypothetical protein